MTTLDPFDTADYYDARDNAEHLSHDGAEE